MILSRAMHPTLRVGRAWPVLAVLGCGLAACARPEPPMPVADAVAEALWLPAQAVLAEDAARPALIKNGRSVYVDHSGAVVFTIAVACSDVVRTLSTLT
jgi:hypothetical protein